MTTKQRESLSPHVPARSPHRFGRLLAAAALLAMPAAASAQQAEPPNWAQARVVQVKADRVADWEDRVKEIVSARDEAGLPPLTVYEEVRGQARTYHVILPLQELAIFDDPPQAMDEGASAEWQSRIAETEAAHHVFIVRTYPQYTLEAEGEAAADPALLALYRRRNRPGQMQAYEQWLADELVPALREAGLPHNVSRGFMGTSERMWYHTIPVPSWAAFDGPDPLVEALGEAEAERILSRGGELVEDLDNVLLRPRPDLSQAAM